MLERNWSETPTQMLQGPRWSASMPMAPDPTGSHQDCKEMPRQLCQPRTIIQMQPCHQSRSTPLRERTRTSIPSLNRSRLKSLISNSPSTRVTQALHESNNLMVRISRHLHQSRKMKSSILKHKPRWLPLEMFLIKASQTVFQLEQVLKHGNNSKE